MTTTSLAERYLTRGSGPNTPHETPKPRTGRWKGGASRLSSAGSLFGIGYPTCSVISRAASLVAT